MKPIGGFFSFELPSPIFPDWHATALALDKGRACLSVILKHLTPKRIYVPYYTCDALLEPLKTAGICYVFYGIDEKFKIVDAPDLSEDEMIIYVNYFGLMNDYVNELLLSYGDALIVDNTQDFFTRGYEKGWSFNSARKTFGVPDGGFLYGPTHLLSNTQELAQNAGLSIQHLVARLAGFQAMAYQSFVSAEESLINTPPLRISKLSAGLLAAIDIAAAAERRRENFQYYSEKLAQYNAISINLNILDTKDVPFCYPLLLDKAVERRILFEQQIFIPWFWRDTLVRCPTGYLWEKHVTEALLPLPVDHRYDAADIERVIETICQLILSLEHE